MADAEPTTTKTCPDCAEEVLAEANVCKHCGFRFDTPDPAGATAWARVDRETRILVILVAVVLVAGCGFWWWSSRDDKPSARECYAAALQERPLPDGC